MSNINKVKKAQRDVEVLQSALAGVHGGLETVGAMVETADEIRKGVRGLVKLGLVLAVLGVAVAIVLRVRRSADPDDPEPNSTEPASD